MKNIAKSLTVLFALCTIMVSCQKENEAPEDLTKFAGQYTLSIEVTPNEVPVKSTSVWDGTLTISLSEDPSIVDVIGTVNMSGQEVDLYHTIGSLDNEGRLVLEKSNFINDASGMVAEITYEPISYAETLHWNGRLSTTMQGYDISYELSNTAKLK